MENDIERTVPALLTSMGHAAGAAAELGDSIVLLQNTGPRIQGDIDALASAADAVEVAKAGFASYRDNVREVVRSCRRMLLLARDNFKPVFGLEFNPAWEITGLAGSLVIPESAADVLPLLRSFKAFLGANPAREIPALNITALNFGELFVGLSGAMEELSGQELVLDKAREVREQKTQQARKRMRALIDELTLLLHPLDVRWKRFGFNMPGAQARPEVVENVHVTLLNNSSAALTWTTPPRADYFHVLKKVVGVDQELILVGSPSDPNFTLGELPANSTIEVAISAVNNGGEGPASEVVKILTQ